jgi:hypothetical protein
VLSVACNGIVRVSRPLLTGITYKSMRVTVKLTFPVLDAYVSDWRETLFGHHSRKRFDPVLTANSQVIAATELACQANGGVTINEKV